MAACKRVLLLLLLVSGLASFALSDASLDHGHDENMMLQLQSSSKRISGSYLKLEIEERKPIIIRPCDTLEDTAVGAEEEALKKGLRGMCKQHPELMQAEVAPGFEQNYAKWYDDDGWIDEAYVNYFTNLGFEKEASKLYGFSKFVEMVDLLTESVHIFSKKPIVVFNFGGPNLETWTPERFPQLVLFNVPHQLMEGVSRNWDKIRAMMLAQVRTGMQVDSDMFIYSHADKLFQRTRDEVTPEYPWPILPGHWMSRDPDPEYVNRTEYSCYAFQCPDCPSRTMRWGMAHPTWTFHALPFLGELINGGLSQPKRVLDMSPEASQPVYEDEDFFNVGLWQVGAWKQWCKFETPYPDEWPKYLMSDVKHMNDCCRFQDPKWFPSGMPIAFYIAHGAKKPKETREYLDYLKALHLDKKRSLPEVYFNHSFYKTKDDMLHKLGYQDRHKGTNSTAPDVYRCLL